MLTFEVGCVILFRRSSESNAGLAQLVEQLICNQQVGGSSPSTSSTFLSQVYSDLKPKRVAPLRKHHGVMFLGARCAAAVPQARQTFEERLCPSTSSIFLRRAHN